jgi:hypothetical protein
VKRFINPVPQFLKSNGDLCSSGKLYFYESGSDSTLKNVYGDADGATALTNPVNLTGEGRISNIFGDGEYRVKLYDSADVLQWSRDIDFSADSSQFDLWNSQNTYSINDIARGEDGSYYISQTNGNKGNDPTSISSADQWSKIALIEFWNADKVGGYADNVVVIHEGRLYASNVAANTTEPPDASWDDLSFNNTVTGDLTVTEDVIARNLTVMARKNNSTARSSTVTLAADPDLVLTGLTTGWIYAVEGQIRWNDAGGGAGNGIKLSLDDGTNNAIFSCIFSQTDSVTTPVAKNGLTEAEFTAGLAGSDSYITFNAMVRLEGGATSLALKWAQSVSSATGTTVEVGYIKAIGVPN